MSTIFTKIIQGDIPSYKVAESENCYAFLDIEPVTRGHVLVVPKIETDYIFDLSNDQLADLMNFAKHVAQKLDRVFDCDRVGVSVIGLEVPHAHVHLMPINGITDMDFGKEKLKLTEDEMESIAKSIREA
ncbi:MAG: HIT family protein [Bacteroidota bacterium]